MVEMDAESTKVIVEKYYDPSELEGRLTRVVIRAGLAWTMRSEFLIPKNQHSRNTSSQLQVYVIASITIAESMY
jgi:hypothetical protein